MKYKIGDILQSKLNKESKMSKRDNSYYLGDCCGLTNV